MGNQSSKAVTNTDIVNKAITNIIMESSQNCTSNVSVDQELTFSNIRAKACKVDFSNISQEATVTQNFSCAQESSQSADLQNKLKTTLDAQTEAVTKGMTIGQNTSESLTLTKLKNEVVNNVNVSSIANCVASAISKQKLAFEKIDVDCTGADDKTLSFNNIKQLLTMTQVSKCTAGNAQSAKAITEFENELKLKSSAVTSGIDFAASLASFGSFLIPTIICIILSIIACIVYSQLK